MPKGIHEKERKKTSQSGVEIGLLRGSARSQEAEAKRTSENIAAERQEPRRNIGGDG